MKTNRIPILGITAAALAAVTIMASSARAEVVQGHGGVTNRVYPHPILPGYLLVEFQGDGVLSGVGLWTGGSTNQVVSLATGQYTATFTLTDGNGDQLVFDVLGQAVFQAPPDLRVTFTGSMTVISGTGRLANVSGTLQFDGMGMTTNFATGEGWGFFSLDGDLNLPGLRSWTPSTIRQSGTGVTSGLDFTYTGQGNVSHIGRIRSDAHSVPTAPINGFLGVVNGKVLFAQTVLDTWTTPNGDTLTSKTIGFLFVEPLVLPGGQVVPDFSKPVGSLSYRASGWGTGRLRGLEGAYRMTGDILPTSPTTVRVPEFVGSGWLRQRPGK